jgi:pyruvate kinase
MIRRTKIVCTLGPAVATEERLGALLDHGMDVARINFSHGDRAFHGDLIAKARRLACERDRPLAILADLQGPRIRVGELPEPVELRPGDVVVFAPEGEHRAGELPTTYPGLAYDLEVGDVVLLADGRMELIVEDVLPPRVKLRVIHGGTLTSHKGINLPGVRTSIPSLTEKDLADLAFAIEQEVDYIALSFVREPADVYDLLRRLPPGGPLVVVKIEQGVALQNLRAIFEPAAAVMVARGDLGVELPFERVPLVQKQLIHLANLSSRPVITATQMLESMIENPRPTRAEASDVANAIIDGTDAVMLSGETAVGQFPIEAVKAMARIAQEIEDSHIIEGGPHYDVPVSVGDGRTPTDRAVAAATVEAVRRLKAPLVLTFTSTGATARVVSSFRPPVPILALTESERTYHQLALVWGVVPVLCPPGLSFDDMLDFGREVILQRHLARPGDRIVVTAGVPMHVPGTTNLLRIESI